MDETQLQILISAVDEASETIAGVGEAMAGMSEDITESVTGVNASMEELQENVAATGTAVGLSYSQMTELLAQDSAEIQQLMLDEGLSAQEAASVIEEANATIAASSESASTSSAGAYGGLAAIAGIAFLGIKSAIGDAVSAATTWDETSAEIAQTLKDTGSSIPLSEIQDYAEQVQSLTLFSQNDVLASEEMILSHTNLQASYQSVTMVAADLATKMSTDLPNATRVLTNALTDPVAGLNQLIRQGNIQFPAAIVTMIENMAKAGDTAGADAVIMSELSGSIGGVAQAAAGAPGAALAQLSNQLTSLGIVVGNDLLPLLDTLATDLIPIITDIMNWAAEHPKLTDAIVIGVAALTALALVIGVVGVAIITVTPVVEALGIVITALTGPIGLAITAGVLLTAGIIANWKDIEEQTEATWTLIGMFFTATWDSIKSLFTTSLDDVKNVWDAAWNDMSNVVQTIWQTIANVVKSGVNEVISAINGFINALDAIHISLPSISIPGTKLATPAVNLGFSIPDIPMLAAGGFVTQPTLALIGEAGPEAVIPLSSGGFGGGGGQQINVYIQGGIFPADQSAIKQIGDMLAKQINQSLRVRNYAS